MKLKLLLLSIVSFIAIITVAVVASKHRSDHYVNFFSTCNLDAFFAPDYSTNLQSRRHWIRQQTQAQKDLENSLMSRTDIPQERLSELIDDFNALHVQLRLAGLQKLQQSKPANFNEAQKEDDTLKYSCTFTPQIEPIFSIGRRTMCNLVHKGKVFNNPRLRPTTADGIAVKDTCYIRIPNNVEVDSDTRKAILMDVINILEAVGKKVDYDTISKIDKLEANIQALQKQNYNLENHTLPKSRNLEQAKYQEYMNANTEYQNVAYQMDSSNPSSVYNVYYSLMGRK